MQKNVIAKAGETRGSRTALFKNNTTLRCYDLIKAVQ